MRSPPIENGLAFLSFLGLRNPPSSSVVLVSLRDQGVFYDPSPSFRILSPFCPSPPLYLPEAFPTLDSSQSLQWTKLHRLTVNAFTNVLLSFRSLLNVISESSANVEVLGKRSLTPPLPFPRKLACLSFSIRCLPCTRNLAFPSFP